MADVPFTRRHDMGGTEIVLAEYAIVQDLSPPRACASGAPTAD